MTSMSGSSLTHAGARWLITGAAGQLGRSLTALARAHGLEVTPLTFEELDITDEGSVRSALDKVDPDVLVNCAAFTAVDACESATRAAFAANADGPNLLARAARERCVMVHWSTDYVFDGDRATPWPEMAAPQPVSAYGRSKLAGERAVHEAGGDHLIVRTQWLMGPGPNFVRTILTAAAEGRELRVVDDQLGRPSWTGALASALLAALDAEVRGVLHLACEGIASWYDLAHAAVHEGARRGLNTEVPLVAIPTSEMPRPARRPAYGVLSLEKARGLGITLPHWRDALGAYLDAERDGRDV
jgi:dTDP-4-dehydrorhamnose reductase